MLEKLQENVHQSIVKLRQEKETVQMLHAIYQR